MASVENDPATNFENLEDGEEARMDSENMSEEENKNCSPVAARKRKSSGQLAPTSARKVLSELNRGPVLSALPAPGWTKSANKQSRNNTRVTRSSSRRSGENQPPASSSSSSFASGPAVQHNNQHDEEEMLVELPSETLDCIVTRCFGDPDEREQQRSLLLKRVKPEQKIFGYAKKFLETETKRLAQGLRDSYTTCDQFVDSCKTYERNILSSIESAKLRVDQLAHTAEESKAKLAAAERALDAARKEEATLRAEVQTAKHELKISADREASSTQKAKDLEGRKNDLEIRLHQAENTVQQKEQELQDANRRLEEHNAELGRLRTEFEEKLATVRSEKDRIADEIPRLRERGEVLEKERDRAQEEIKETSTKLHKTEAEVHRLEVSTAALQAQITNMESQVKQKDLHLDKTLETFQQNQTFSQERIAMLSEEKAKLEVRVTDLSNTKGSLEVEKARLEGNLKEVTDARIALVAANESLQEELDNLKEKSAGAISELEKAKRDAAAATVRAEKLEAELNKRNIAAKELEQSNETLQQQLKEATDANNALESEKEALKKTYSEQGISSDERLERLCEVSKEAAMLKRQVNDLDKLQERLRQTETTLKETQNRLFESDKARRRLHNEVQMLKGKIRVVARVRPSTTDADEQVSCDVNGTSLQLATERAQTSGVQVQKHEFEFDRVFAPKSSQEEVFDEVSDFVQSALDGFNVCLFSYGQTGSGKTFTMTGDHASAVERGIIPRAIDQIMSYQTELRSKGWEYTLEATYVEIYNETIRDLLTRNGKSDAKPEIRDSKKEIILSNVNREPISSKDQIHQVLDLAQRNRSVAATDSNMHSSRSHSVFTLYITGVNKEFKAQVTGSLSMCDLAGSERIAKSNATGDRLKEAQAINKSLSSLAGVFSSLQKKTAHVPYRNSKLTHMLQPCFAGEGKTMMIVNLSPEYEHANESLCSLRFAGGVQKTELGRAKKQIATLQS